MPRPLTFGNAFLHVGIDGHCWIRDLHASRPEGRLENHLNGHPIRLGFWTPAGFSWTDEPHWEIEMRTEGPVGTTRLRNGALGVDLTVRDELAGSLFARRFEFAAGGEVRLFTSHDLRLCESDVGDTALYHPGIDALVHYKGRVWVGFAARTAGGGLDGFATGLKAFDGHEGTWRDAEDGALEGVPISQGSVDSTLCVQLNPAAGNWVEWAMAVAGSCEELEAQMGAWEACLQSGASEPPRPSGGEGAGGEGRALPQPPEGGAPHPALPPIADAPGGGFPGVSPKWASLFEASLAQIEAHAHADGGILAALDSDIMATNRATYAYVWPRDGALVAHAMDRAGRHEVPAAFFGFAARLIETYGPRLYQKFHTDGSFGASWHPWTVGGRPHQGDQLPLVLHAAAAHPRSALAREAVEAAARYLREDRDPATGLPFPSYDLWEERLGTHTFTTAAVVAGLRAASKLLGDATYGRAADETLGALETHLVNPDTGTLIRGLDAEGKPDLTPDASLLMVPLLGALPFDHPTVAATIPWLEQSLWVHSPIGGVARYPGDYYFRRSEAFPGNPWVIATLWLARCLVRVPGGHARASQLIDWACDRAHPTGALPEQVHPETGEVLGVSPLVWSHAELVAAVLDVAEHNGGE